jgi:hypothetical protein
MPPSTRRRGEVFACVAAPAHASPDPAHGRHELRSYWRILRAQPRRRSRASGQASAKFADMTAKESTAKERARVAAQRGHSTPEALHTPAAGHRGMARLPRKQNRAPALRGPQHRVRTHATWAACLLCHLHAGRLQAPDARWRAEKIRAQAVAHGTFLGRRDAGRGRLGSGPQAL